MVLEPKNYCFEGFFFSHGFCFSVPLHFFIHLDGKPKLLTHLLSRQMKAAGTLVGCTRVCAEKKPASIIESEQSHCEVFPFVYMSVQLLTQF